jgi:RNA polymerase sigma factor (sigma-70 family)
MTREEEQRLFAEFEKYYCGNADDTAGSWPGVHSVCEWAPRNPWRVFRFVFKTVYEHWERQVSESEFLSIVYLVLGDGDSSDDGEMRGLIYGFRPELYHGSLPLQEHFLNMLKKRLWSRVRRYVKRQQQMPSIHLRPPIVLVPVNKETVRVKMLPPQRGRTFWFAHWKGLPDSRCTGELDLDKAVDVVKRMLGVPHAVVKLPNRVTPQPVKEALYRWRRGSGRQLATVAVGEPARAEKDFKLALHVAVSRLRDDQRQVVQSVYWDDLTLRQTAKLMGVNHSRVVRLHADALRRLEGRLAA